MPEYDDVSFETERCGSVLKAVMFDAAKSALDMMSALEEIDKSVERGYLARVALVLEPLDLDGEQPAEVAKGIAWGEAGRDKDEEEKALDAGEITSDSAKLTQGGALVTQSLRRKVIKTSYGDAVHECVKSLQAGWRPWPNGVSVTALSATTGLAGWMKDNFECSDEQAAELGVLVLGELQQAASGL